MQRADFHYDLPDELIAQAPLADRSGSRLLVLGQAPDPAEAAVRHLQFDALPSLLRSGDLLVFNDTRVIPARLLGRKDSGGRVEVLVERIEEDGRVLAQVRASKTPGPGRTLVLGDDRDEGFEAVVLGRRDDLFELSFPASRPPLAWLESHGHVPLPPYIERADDSDDAQRYQTVYAREAGAVAAPTAGLHFDEALLSACAEAGIERAFVTLHVGAGTFQPVRVDDIESHRMHAERWRLPPETVAAIAACRARGGRVVAVGTTVVRTLESAALERAVVAGAPQAGEGETEIFIYPPYRFRVVDALITNFHLPESTLLMLVSAFAGRERVLGAYEAAVAERYRFFSYGDAMLIEAMAEAIDVEARGGA